MASAGTHLTLDALLVLDAIERAGSFAAAAEKLNRVPSAVSYTVNKLEHDLDVRIFDRSGYRAKLTPAGHQLLEDGRELLRLAAEAELKAQQLHAGWEGRIRIAVAELVPRKLIFPLLRAFHDSAEHRGTSLEITTESLASCWSALDTGRCDVAVGAPEPVPDGARFTTKPLGSVELVLVVPNSHPLAAADEPLTDRDVAAYVSVQHSARPTARSGSHRHSQVFTVDDYPSLADAIRCGIGIGFLPLHLVRAELGAGLLVAKQTLDAPKVQVMTAIRATGCGRGARWLIERLGDLDLRAALALINGPAAEFARIF